MLIAVGLCIGIAVFAVFTFQELAEGSTTYAPPQDFGTANSAAPAPAPPKPGVKSITSLASTDPSKFIPIERSNPHPGQIAPFLRADPYGQMPYQQPAVGGEIWEFCAYRVRDASLTDLFAHYNEQARLLGMTLLKQNPTSNNMPGGTVVSWSDGRRSLEVTAAPLPATQPAAPPLAPPTPLQWVVKYSYPTQTP